ncbi:hypothetical protein AVEN_26662-1 [Araneus ventricosus]|uniref:C2H2-type domain-containing protein n=1 Tax=Araneus ventricosus TaxID=182803 RepID=A0A4Y2N758_ARAVE|nr:hypothetical protein AVEN_26662-1 [Araneus ventricosus]
MHLETESTSHGEVPTQSVEDGASTATGHPCLEEGCNYNLKNRHEFREHLKLLHGKDFTFNELEFMTYDEFFKWKLKFENDNQVQFIKPSGLKKRKHGYIQYFHCFRSGKYHNKGQGKRITQRSEKIGNICTAEIKMYIRENGKITAKVCNTHYGHGDSLSYMKLTEAEKKTIAHSLKMKIDIPVILEKLRNDMLESPNLARIHLTTRQDIKNIQRNFGLSVERHRDDATSVRLMIEEMATLDGDNPVLGFKFQGSVPPEYENFLENDFIIVLQNPLQKEMLKKFGNNVVCLDSTHGTNAYNFKLITILIIDEFGEGFPAAWCISNREDYTALKKFFGLVKKNLAEDLTTKFFMSDDAPAFHNAWVDVFGFSEHKLLCSFHFDKIIRSQVNRLISDKIKACEVYKILSIIFSKTGEEQFLTMFEKFKSDLIVDKDTENFGNYFLTNYEHRVKEIAKCYRLGSPVTTNNHLESFYKDLKYNFLCGKSNKRLDHCFYKLMEYIKNKGCQRIIKLERGKISSQIRTILSRHKRSFQLDFNQISKETEDSYIVKGEKSNYNVEVKEQSCSKTCSVKCSECNICIHEIKCSCLDSVVNVTICKHAHLVCRKRINKERSTHIPQDISTTISNIHNLIQNTNQKQQRVPDFLKNTEELLEEIRNQASRLDPVTNKAKFLEINAKLRNIVNFIKIGNQENKLPKSSANGNQNIITQNSFFSTKKKQQKIPNMLCKPSFQEKEDITKNFISAIVVPETDHEVYCLKKVPENEGKPLPKKEKNRDASI